MVCILMPEAKVLVVQLSLTLQPHGLYVACQAPLSMDSLGKNTGVCSRSLLQGIFLTQGLKLGLLHCKQILYHLSHQISALILIIYFCLITLDLICSSFLVS